MLPDESVSVYDRLAVPTERETALIAQYHDLLSRDGSFQALADLAPAERRARVQEAVAARLRADLILRGQEIERLTQFITDELAGLGPLQPLCDDPAITEIMVNGPKLVFIERAGQLYVTPITFRDAKHVLNIVEWVIGPLGRRLDQSNPRVDGRLPDGSRLHAIIPPIARSGPYLTIRRFRSSP
jgi:pilus assembly protein CpaF